MMIDYIKHWKISIRLLSPKGLDLSSSEVTTMMSYEYLSRIYYAYTGNLNMHVYYFFYH